MLVSKQKSGKNVLWVIILDMILAGHLQFVTILYGLWNAEGCESHWKMCKHEIA